MNLKDISILSGVGVLLISFIASAGVAKKNIEESKEKISQLEKTYTNVAIQQGRIEEKLENLEEQNKELKKDIKETLKEQQIILLEEIRKKKR